MTDTGFSHLGLAAPLQRALIDAGYQTPTPIQQQAIPALLDGEDLLGIAQTGTGKTAAFSLPLLHHLHSNRRSAKPKRPLGLILAPTRELALQIGEEIAKFSAHLKTSQVVIFGGVGQNPQVRALAKGVDILIATPGRLLDLANQGHLNLGSVEFLVLDEADRLLDMGFIRDVKRIVQQTPKTRHSLLFSATMPAEVAKLAKEMLTRPQRVEVTPKQITVKRIEQKVVLADNVNKRRVLAKVLRERAVSRAIVFTRTKHGANKVARQLESDGITAVAIHGNKSQSARQKALASFKGGDAWVLVATDIAARGIDIDGVSHVINYELPHEPESYVHRIGRTGRAGAEGVAWSLVDPAEQKRLRAVEKLIRFSIERWDVSLPAVDEPNAGSSTSSRPLASTPRKEHSRDSSSGLQRKPKRRRRRRPAGSAKAPAKASGR